MANCTLSRALGGGMLAVCTRLSQVNRHCLSWPDIHFESNLPLRALECITVTFLTRTFPPALTKNVSPP